MFARQWGDGDGALAGIRAERGERKELIPLGAGEDGDHDGRVKGGGGSPSCSEWLVGVAPAAAATWRSRSHRFAAEENRKKKFRGMPQMQGRGWRRRESSGLTKLAGKRRIWRRTAALQRAMATAWGKEGEWKMRGNDEGGSGLLIAWVAR